ncbi:MAG: hypothetical protein V9H26_04735 [Verrucomicrobiota bacterium]
MKIKILLLAGWLFTCMLASVHAEESVPAAPATLLFDQPIGATLWWALSSAAKIRPDQPPPTTKNGTIRLSSARNEREAVQFIVRPSRRLEDCRLTCGDLTGGSGARIAANQIEFLQVHYLEISEPTDRVSKKGLWPDPLLPISGPLELPPDFNHAFWVRVFVASNTPAGTYRGTVELRATGLAAHIPIELTVYNFTLPDRMTCTTAFGFSPQNVFRYHGLNTETEKRLVLDKYLSDFAAHHIAPYDPAPLDPIRVQWPDIRPPKTSWDNWTGLRIVANEAHSGHGALLIYDDKVNENVTVGYEPLIKLPAKGLRVRGWYRTAVPGHRFLVTLESFRRTEAVAVGA